MQGFTASGFTIINDDPPPASAGLAAAHRLRHLVSAAGDISGELPQIDTGTH
jgi:hypothetical protein